MTHAHQYEIEQNYQFFRGFVHSVVGEHRGHYAVLRHRDCVGIYGSLFDAVTESDKKYQDGEFSIQEITDAPLDLGFFSHASSEGGLPNG